MNKKMLLKPHILRMMALLLLVMLSFSFINTDINELEISKNNISTEDTITSWSRQVSEIVSTEDVHSIIDKSDVSRSTDRGSKRTTGNSRLFITPATLYTLSYIYESIYVMQSVAVSNSHAFTIRYIHNLDGLKSTSLQF